MAAQSQQGFVMRRLCKQGATPLARQLIVAGVSVDSAQEDGCTGLWLACEAGHADTADMLIDLGADLDAAKSTDSVTPLFIACQNGHTEIVDLLLRHGARMNVCKAPSGASPLFIAAQQGHREVVRVLLNKGANHSATNIHGVTPLMIAAYQCAVPVVVQLLDSGADPHQEAQGRTALEWAAANGHRFEVERVINEHLHRLQAGGRRGRLTAQPGAAPPVLSYTRRTRLDHEVVPFVQPVPSMAGGPIVEGTRPAMNEETLTDSSGAQTPLAQRDLALATQMVGYTPLYLATNQSLLSGRPTTQGSNAQLARTMARTGELSAKTTLGSTVGSMTARKDRTMTGVTERLMETEEMRNRAFSKALASDRLKGKCAARKWNPGARPEAATFTTEQEWESHRRQLSVTTRLAMDSVATGGAKLPDAWLYGGGAAEGYAASMSTIMEERRKAGNAAVLQLQQSRDSGVKNYTLPAVPDEVVASVKTMIECGKGARGPSHDDHTRRRR